MKTRKEWKTIFRTRYEHYEYTMMSFELINASTICQKMINDALREYLDVFVIAYLDDILIYSKILPKHKQHVRIMLQYLEQRRLLLKLEKCEFHQFDIEFFEFVIKIQGIRINSIKFKMIKNWSRSTNVKEVQAFLKFVNYNRKFIKNYSKKVISLINLTNKDKSWNWKTQKQQTFERFRDACLQQSILRMFNSKKSIRIETNASNLIIDVYLNQKNEDKQHFVTYFSRKLSLTKQNYDIHDKKLLAIITSLKIWKIYVEEAFEFTIYTNYKNLLQFIIIKQLNWRQIRWSKFLEQYKFKIQYTPRKKNGRANALSRRINYMNSKEIFNHNILKVNNDETLFANCHEVNMTLKIMRDNQEQFPIVHEKLQISKDKIDEYIKEHHDESLQNHFDVIKTMQLLRRNCQFPNMRQRIETYIKKCLNCQKNKHATHAKYDEIQYMESSKSPWDEVSMNFITKLSKSRNSTNEETYDAILVMINRLIKYCHIISFKETYNVEQLRYIVLNRLIRYHEISKGLINNKDKLFTFNYWKTLLSMLKIKLKMSTIFHSQTNEQTKKTNQSLKQYLRHYINNTQSNWVKLLSMTQLALNVKISNITKVTLFLTNFEKESNLFERSKNLILIETTIQKKNTIKIIQDNIFKIQASSTTYQNKKRKTTPLLKKRNKIYLLTKNLKINKRRNKKLDHVKVESFLIKVVKNQVNYELNFLIDAKIFFVFHIFVLKSTHSNTSIQITFRYQSQKDQKYEVERILQQQS